MQLDKIQFRGFLSIFIAIALLVSQGAFSQQLAIKTYVDRTTLTVNDQLVLTIELSGSDANKVQAPEPPDVSNFLSFLGSGGSSQSIQIINNKMSVKKSYTYYYMANKAGTFQIPAIQIQYKGHTFSSKPITITVTPSQSSAQTQPNAQTTPGKSKTVNIPKGSNRDLFVRAIVNKRRVYQNEPVIVTYRIYTRLNVQNYGISKLPETAGFWVEDLSGSRQPAIREEVINGLRYTVADIRKMALFPTSPGKKKIGTLGLDCQVRVRRQKRYRDPLDAFFDDPFFARTEQKTIFSQPISIEVLPLPAENRPANFTGAVGHFSLKASLDKTEVKTNEAITLKVTVSGTGNIKILPEPQVSIPDDFEKYEPKISQNINRQGNEVSGSKTFEYVLIPRFPGIQKIKPITYSYFDPKAKEYKILSSPEFVIDVQQGETPAISIGSGLNKKEVQLIGKDIRFIKLTTPEFRPIGKRVYNSFAFISLAILPLLTLVASFGYKKHLEKLSENQAYARSRRANRLAQKRLSKAKSYLDERTQKEFYAEVSRALLGFAADKLNLSEAGIITSELEQLLRDKNLDEELIKEYLQLLQVCDYQRFAPATVTKDEMSDFYKSAKQAIVKLEKAI